MLASSHCALETWPARNAAFLGYRSILVLAPKFPEPNVPLAMKPLTLPRS
jgi:hypothetical protein